MHRDDRALVGQATADGEAADEERVEPVRGGAHHQFTDGLPAPHHRSARLQRRREDDARAGVAPERGHRRSPRVEQQDLADRGRRPERGQGEITHMRSARVLKPTTWNPAPTAY